MPAVSLAAIGNRPARRTGPHSLIHETVLEPDILVGLRPSLTDPERTVNQVVIDRGRGIYTSKPGALTRVFVARDPATGAPLGEVPEATTADVDAAVQAAHNAFESPAWAGLLPAQRAKLLWRMADLLEQRADEFARLETVDQGQPLAISAGLAVPNAVDIDAVIEGHLMSSLVNSGHVCAGATRFYVQRQRADEFAEELAGAARLQRGRRLQRHKGMVEDPLRIGGGAVLAETQLTEPGENVFGNHGSGLGVTGI